MCKRTAALADRGRSWVVLILLALLARRAAAADAPPLSRDDGRVLDLPAALVDLLLHERWTATPRGFRIIALSHLADGCAAQAAQHPAESRRCVARALTLAHGLRPRSFAVERAAEHGLYATHLNLILGAQDLAGGPHDAALHTKLSTALAARALREPTHHLPSFPNTAHRWPADQSATLASLRRHDLAHAGSLTEAPARAWQSWLARHATSDGLPWSEATGRARNARLPRGCALGYGVRYTAEFDAALARAWWQTFRARYLVDRLLLVGFREWPPGRDLPADVDSGPIVNGVGAAATALAIAAARALGDGVLAGRLKATAVMVGAAANLDAATAAAARSTLAASILFQSDHQSPPAD